MDDSADHPEAPILDRLRSLGIDYLRIDHPAVFTADEARAKVPPMPGAKAKNLLVQDRSGEQVFMVTVPYDKSVDLKALAAALGTRKLSFVSAESMQELIGVTPGAVSLLGLINDKGCKVLTGHRPGDLGERGAAVPSPGQHRHALDPHGGRRAPVRGHRACADGDRRAGARRAYLTGTAPLLNM